MCTIMYLPHPALQPPRPRNPITETRTTKPQSNHHEKLIVQKEEEKKVRQLMAKACTNGSIAYFTHTIMRGRQQVRLATDGVLTQSPTPTPS